MKVFAWLLILTFVSCTGMNRKNAIHSNENELEIIQIKNTLSTIDRAISLGEYAKALSLASSGFEQVEHIGDIELLLDYRLRLAVINRKIGNFRQSIESFAWINEYSKHKNTKELQIYSSIELGNSYMAINLIDRALSSYIDAYEVQKKYQGENNQNGLIYQSLGRIFDHLSESDKAAFFYIKSIKEASQAHDFFTQIKSMRHLMNYYIVKRNFDKAHHQLLEMKKLAVSIPRLANFAIYMSTAGDYFIESKNYDSAQYYYRKAEKIAKLDLDFRSVAIIQTRIAHVYSQCGNWSDALAENYKALENRLKIGNFAHASSSYANIGINLLNLDRVDEAELSLLKSIELARQMESSVTISATLNKLAKFYIQTNNHKKAIEYMGIINSYNDSIVNAHQKLNVSLIYNAANIENTHPPLDRGFLSFINTPIALIVFSFFGFIGVVLSLYWILTRIKKKRKSTNEHATLLNSIQQALLPISIIDSLSMGLCIIDENNTILLCNKTMERNLGYQPHELDGVNFKTIASHSRNHSLSNDSIKHDDVVIPENEIYLRNINGNLINFRFVASPLQLIDNKQGNLSLFIDIAPEDKLKTLLAEAQSQIALLNQNKEKLVPGIYKQIIDSFNKSAHLVDQCILLNKSEHVGATLEDIGQQISDNLQIINDLNYIQLIENNAFNTNLEEISIEYFFKDLAQKLKDYYSTYHQQKVKIELDFDSGHRGSIVVDVERLSFILCRLCDFVINNSSKNLVTIKSKITIDNHILFVLVDELSNDKYDNQQTAKNIEYQSLDVTILSEEKQFPITLNLVSSFAEQLNGKFWSSTNSELSSTYYLAFPLVNSNHDTTNALS